MTKSRTNEPSSAHRREWSADERALSEVASLLAALAEIMPEQAVGLWLAEPNDAFDGLKPMELVERGESGRLWRMIYLLRSGAPF